MSYTPTNIKVPLLLLILTIGLQSCIREDTSGCYQGLYICFTPENPKHNYAKIVQTLDLYFYDEQGDLAATYNYQEQDLRPKDKAAFVDDLPNGKYTLVSIINDVETYQTTGQQQLQTLQSHLQEKEIKTPLTDFFSGVKPIIVARSATPQTIDKTIIKHNNDIHVEVTTKDYQLPDGTTLNAYIAGNNGAYHYQSATAPQDSYTHYRPYHTEKYPDGIPKRFDFTVMRLWRNSDLTLYLQEENPTQGTERTIHFNIANELAQIINEENEYLYDTDQKLSFHDHYQISVTIGPGLILLRLVINDWVIIGGDIEV